MRGNQRHKPPEELQGKGSRFTGSATIALVPQGAEREIPPPPAGLTATLREFWDAFWSAPISQMVSGADGYDIARYFLLLRDRERLEKKIRKDPTVEGSMGQPVVNPLLAVAKEMTREIERYREQLGILPLARMRLGVTTGMAQEATARGLRAQLDAKAAAGANSAQPAKRVFGAGGA